MSRGLDPAVLSFATSPPSNAEAPIHVGCPSFVVLTFAHGYTHTRTPLAFRAPSQFFVSVINWDVSLGFGVYPAADSTLVDHSARLAKDVHAPVARKDGTAMSQDDEDALAPYGAFVVIGLMASQMYDAVFGGLVQVPIKTKEMDGKIKRTPSGAELSATLGLTVKKSLGLDNKSRKVKIRGLI